MGAWPRDSKGHWGRNKQGSPHTSPHQPEGPAACSAEDEQVTHGTRVRVSTNTVTRIHMHRSPLCRQGPSLATEAQLVLHKWARERASRPAQSSSSSDLRPTELGSPPHTWVRDHWPQILLSSTNSLFFPIFSIYFFFCMDYKISLNCHNGIKEYHLRCVQDARMAEDTCYGLNCVPSTPPPQYSYVEALTPTVMVF